MKDDRRERVIAETVSKTW